MTNVRIRVAVLAVLSTMAAGVSAATGAHAAAPSDSALGAAGSGHHLSGDFDGDGHRDLAVGAPGVNRVRLTYTHAKVKGSHSVALRPDSHPQEAMNFGAVLSAGDVNHDGYSDLLVAAPQYTTATRVGAVFLFLGSAHGLRKTPLTIIDPDAADSDIDFANEVAVATLDANHDGYTDVAVATDSSVRIYHGYAHGLRTTGVTKLHIDGGESLAVGDVNGDHRPDLVVGREVGDVNTAGDIDGQIDVFLGTKHGLAAKRHSIFGNQVGEGSDPSFAGFGAAITAGDFNGDGYADVAAGVPGGPEPGSSVMYSGNVVVLFGSAHGLSSAHRQVFNERSVYAGTAEDDDFGSSVAQGMITADRYSDLVVGDPGSSVQGHASAGAVFVIHGSKNGLTAAGAQRITQATPGVPGTAAADAQFGTTVYVADVAGNKRADLVVGTPFAAHPGYQAGTTVRLLGTATGVTTHQATSQSSSTTGALFGTAID